MKIEKTITINIDKRVVFALHALLYLFAGFILLMIASECYFAHEQSLINSWNFYMQMFGANIRIFTGRIIYELIYFFWTYFFFDKIFAGKKMQKSVKFFPLILGIIIFVMLTFSKFGSAMGLNIPLEIFYATLRSIHALIIGIIVTGIVNHLDNKQMKGLQK